MLNNKASLIGLFLICFFIANTSTFAKSKDLIIKGVVLEKGSKEPLSFATISAFDHTKKVVAGTTANDLGSFTLDCKAYDVSEIKISFIGYNDTTINISQFTRIIDNSINIGEVNLATNNITLSSAIITAKVPLVEQKMDKLVMNISESAIAHGNNALELLRVAPGVSLDPSDNIMLNGKAVQIWMNGKPTNLSGADLENLLNGTDGSIIDKIEIMAHPSSKYDASGSGGIINIRTKRNFRLGLNGSLKGGYGIGYDKKSYNNYDGSLNLNYRTDKSSSSITYSPRYNQGFQTMKTKTILENNSLIDSYTKMNRNTDFHNLMFSSEFYLNSKNTIGFGITGITRESKEKTDDQTGSMFFNGNGELIKEAFTIIDNNFSFDNLSSNINYTYTPTKNQEITVNGDYFIYKLGRDSYQSNDYNDFINQNLKSIFRSDSEQKINIGSLKIDYENSIDKVGKVEAGLKWARSITDNDILWEDMINSTWKTNSDLSSNFEYREDILAGYFSIASRIKSLIDIKGGLRAEYTNSRGDWKSADTVTTKSYIDLFPTLYAGYSLNSNYRLGLSYTLRIRRPNFQELNPQRFYIDATSFGLGNPEISPEYTHQLSLSIGIKRHLNISFNSHLTRKQIIQMPSFDHQTGEKMFIWDNFGKNNNFGINISLTELPICKWYTLSANTYVSYMESISNDYYRSSFVGQLNLNNTILLPLDYKLEISSWAVTNAPYGSFNIKAQSNLTMALKKNFMQNRAILTVMATDILGTNRNKIEVKDIDVKSYDFKSKYNSKRVAVSFTYNFGQNNKAKKSRRVGNIEESRRVSTGN